MFRRGAEKRTLGQKKLTRRCGKNKVPILDTIDAETGAHVLTKNGDAARVPEKQASRNKEQIQESRFETLDTVRSKTGTVEQQYNT